MSLAIFDLDDTILDNDTDRVWSSYLLKNQYVDEAFLKTSENFYKAYHEGGFDIYLYVEHLIRPILKLSQQEQNTLQADFYHSMLKQYIRPKAVEQLKLHIAQNDTCLIITAANEFLVRGFVETLGVRDTLATKLKRSTEGAVLNQIEGEPCFQRGKCDYLRDYLGNDLNAFDKITVYTDSLHDLPLLKLATHPVLINPKSTPAIDQAIIDNGLEVMYF